MMNENKEKRVAIYIRTANADQLSIKKQEAELRHYAAEQDCTEPLIYADNGHSGLSFHRPAFMRLEQDIQNGTIGKVIAVDLSRIGRNALQVMNWIDSLKEKGVELDVRKPPSAEYMETMNDMFKDAQKRASALMKKGKQRPRER